MTNSSTAGGIATRNGLSNSWFAGRGPCPAPRTQAQVFHPTFRVALRRRHWRRRRTGLLLAPLSGAGPEAALEANVELAQEIEPAPGGHVNDFGAGIAQQGRGLEQAHLHFERGDGKAEVPVEKAVQVPGGAAEFPRQVVDGAFQDLGDGERLQNVVHVLLDANKAGVATGARALEFIGEDGRRGAQQVAAVVDIEARGDIFEKAVGFERDRAVGGIVFGLVERFGDGAEQYQVAARKERKEVLGAKGESGEREGGSAGSVKQRQLSRAVYYQNVAGLEFIGTRVGWVRCGGGAVTVASGIPIAIAIPGGVDWLGHCLLQEGGAARRENEREAIARGMPIAAVGKTDQRQVEVIASEHWGGFNV